MADWKPEGARELSADDWKPEGARPLDAPEPQGAPLKFAKPGDIGAAGTLGAHTARHLSFGLGDKVIAGLSALDDLSHREGSGSVGPLYGALKHALTPGDHTLSDAYKRDLAFNDQALEASDEAHPVARWAGNAAGVAGSMLVPGGALRLMRGAPAAVAAAPAVSQGLWQLTKSGAAAGAKNGTAIGALGGLGSSRSDDLGGTVADTALGAGIGLVGGTILGGLAPVASRGLVKLGDKAKDAAGKLKVNSLRPTPTLGEAMEALPGGRAGVGRELLRRNIGGLTKHSTAAQIERELDATGSSISDVARKYDASGGAPLELTRPIDRTLEHAEQLSYEPTTRPAAEKLAETVNEYRDTYGSAPVSATDALKFKRTLGDAAYEAGDQLQRSGDHVAGRYGKGLGGLERGVNSELETALGPEFAQANLSYRRLLGAGQAADRGAARVHSNHPLGLIPMVAGVGGAAHGAKEGLGAMAAAMLVNKYGSQAGARALYGVGNALESGAVRSAAESPSGYTRALIEALRRRQEAAQMTPVAAPMFAQGDSHEQE
jgi:hypothetical protein